MATKSYNLAEYSWTSAGAKSITVVAHDSTDLRADSAPSNAITYNVYTLGFTLGTGLSISGTTPTLIGEGQTKTVTLVAASGYVLPTGITVTGAIYDYDSSTGEVEITSPTGNVTVTASAVATYPITLSLSHCTASGTDLDHILAGEEKSITITADVGYSLPDSVTVTGCQKLWVKATGELVLSNPTGAVTVTCTAERLVMPTPQNVAVGLTSFGGYIYALSCDPVTNAVNYEVAWSTTPTGAKESMGAGPWTGTGRPQFNVGTLSAGTYYMFVRAKGVGSYADSEWSNYVVLTLYGITVDSDTSHTIRDMTDDYGTELTTNVVMANHTLKVTALPATGMVVDTENSSVAMAGEAQPRAFVNNVVEILAVTGAITVTLYSIQAPLDAPVITKSGTAISWNSVANATEYYVKDGNTTIATVPEGYSLQITLTSDSNPLVSVIDGSQTYPGFETGSKTYTITSGHFELQGGGDGVANVTYNGGVNNVDYGPPGTGAEVEGDINGNGSITLKFTGIFRYDYN